MAWKISDKTEDGFNLVNVVRQDLALSQGAINLSNEIEVSGVPVQAKYPYFGFAGSEYFSILTKKGLLKLTPDSTPVHTDYVVSDVGKTVLNLVNNYIS